MISLIGFLIEWLIEWLIVPVVAGPLYLIEFLSAVAIVAVVVRGALRTFREFHTVTLQLEGLQFKVKLQASGEILNTRSMLTGTCCLAIYLESAVKRPLVFLRPPCVLIL